MNWRGYMRDEISFLINTVIAVPNSPRSGRTSADYADYSSPRARDSFRGSLRSTAPPKFFLMYFDHLNLNILGEV